MISSSCFTGYAQSGNVHVLETDGPAIRVQFVTDDIIRIRASFDRIFHEESYVLTMTSWEDRLDSVLGVERRRVPGVAPKVTATETAVIFESESLRLFVHKEPFGIEIFDADGTRLHADVRGRAYVRDRLGRIVHYRERASGDRYYGFGETTGRLDKAGSRVRLSPKDAIGYDAERTSCLYKHIPFHVSMNADTRHAVGLFYHNPWDAEFDLGSEISGYWPRYTSYQADGGDIDLFFINGPSIARVIERYTDLTGKTVMPPKASLGYLGSTMYYVELEKDCDSAIVGFVEKTREEGIPIDGFQLSSGYTVGPGNKRYVFTWNTTRFPDPEAFFARMNALGAPVSPNIKPGILTTHPHYDAFANEGGFVRDPKADAPYIDRWWGGPGSFVDFTNPKGRDVWKNFIIDSLASKGVSSIWNDNCEYEMNDRDARCDGDGAEMPSGATRNVQANLMSMTSHRALRESRPNERPYVICRSGGAGIQRYAQTWAGDNFTAFKTLRWNIATMLGMGMSGVANQGCDVGGFAGPSPSAELLVRWVQNGIFQPRFSIHSSNDNNTVTEPWMYGETYTALIRDAIRLRYALFPYLYALMRQAHETGVPILRPLIYEFQDDRACDGEDCSFMFGPALLVANVVEEGATTRSVYLPAGCDWFEWSGRKRHAGGSTVTVDVDLATIPMFIRDGSFLPTAPGLTSLLGDKIDTLECLVAPGRDARFTLYEDDGVSNAHENGDFRKTRVDLRAGRRTVLDFRPEGPYASSVKTMILDVINERRGAFWVSVAGRRLDQYLDRRKWAASESGWIYDAGQSAVRVKYPVPDGAYEVVVSFENFDLIGMDDE